MIRGLSFNVPNQRFAVIYSILEGIGIANYYWYVAQEDVMDDYFKSDKYRGDEFEKIIYDDNCYAIFLNLQAYKSEKDITKIVSYDDYLKSKCELVLFIDDNIYIRVYAKDFNTIEKVKENAEKNGFMNINYITDENDKIRMFRV